MLIANNLSYKRKDRIIFNNLNISLSPKKIIQIRGRNGIGKTTLIKVLSNILVPIEGEIYWNGKNISKDIYNYYNSFTLIMDINTSKKDMTVKENINFWIKLFRSKIDLKEIDMTLNSLGMSSYENIFVKHLSYGEIRRLELIRLIIEKKKFWIIDEPYLGLDNEMIQILNETFKRHAEQDGLILFSSHLSPQIPKIQQLEMIDHANI